MDDLFWESLSVFLKSFLALSFNAFTSELILWDSLLIFLDILSILSSSSDKTAITEFTATPSVPSLTTILATIPSSIASTSIVALSVSISAITSPERTLSPCFTSHFDNTPSVIVGDKAGIKISIAIFKILFCVANLQGRPNNIITLR